jgi:streptomycin 6-kinase
MFDAYLDRWGLVADGEVVTTSRASLLPVTRSGRRAMLKVAHFHTETVGNAVLAWWEGRGAARVLELDGAAVLLERAQSAGSLLQLYDEGRDTEAAGVIARLAAELHAPRRASPPTGIVPLSTWFADLQPAAERLGGVIRASAHAAMALVSTPTDEAILHGDLHHENILLFDDGGWRAIDPKGVRGETTFEYVPHLLDPDDTGPLDVERLERQIDLMVAAAGLDAARVRTWLLAWAGLCAVWWLEDGKSAEPSLRVADALASTS